MRAAILERSRRAQTARYIHLTNWHRYFAWLPTWVADDDCRWVEWIERKLTYHGGSYGNTLIVSEYRTLAGSVVSQARGDK